LSETASERQTESLRLERTFQAPAEAVFDAWTNPEVLRRWWAAKPSWNCPAAEVDLRVGGSYRLSMEDPDSKTQHVIGGRYTEVQRPRRLAYTWRWEGSEENLQSTVVVEFIARGEHTTVVLEHTRLASVESREGHREGWLGCLENLETRVFADV
jgi:uncharacterized protein YndB with AHSA1/START domain